MKGVVMERDNKKAIVMTDDGQFIELKRHNNTLEVGQEIVVNLRQNMMIKRITSIAATFILFITCSYAAYGYYTPYGYVNVDINPSVEISYNLYNRVIGIEGLNEDGKLVVEKMENYKNKPIDVVINQVVDQAVDEAYIEPEKENTILVTVVEKEKKVDDQKIYNAVEQHVDEIKADAELVVIETKENVREISEQKRITPGKAALIQKVVERDKDINIEELTQKSVKEIVRMIQEKKKEDRIEDRIQEQQNKKRKEIQESISGKNNDKEKAYEVEKEEETKREKDKKIITNEKLNQKINERQTETKKQIKGMQKDVREKINNVKKQGKVTEDKWEKSEDVEKNIREELSKDRYDDIKEKIQEELNLKKYKDIRKKWNERKGKNNINTSKTK